MELSIEDLPADMLGEIVTKLSLLDQLSILRVNKYILSSFKTKDDSIVNYENAWKSQSVLNNLTILRYLIKRNSSFNNSAALNACKYGNVEVIRLLFETRYEHLYNFDKYYFNCFRGAHKHLMDELFRLRCGYDSYNRREISEFLFYGACAGGHIALVKFLIIRAQNNKDNILSERALTNSIKHAYKSGNRDIIQLLTQLGAFKVTPTRPLSFIRQQLAAGIFAGSHYDLYLEFTAGFSDEQRLYLERSYIDLAFSGCHETFIYNLLLFNLPEELLKETAQTCSCFQIAIYKGSENLVQLLLPTVKIIYKTMMATRARKDLDYEFYAFLDYANIYGYIRIVSLLEELVSDLEIKPKRSSDYCVMDYFPCNTDYYDS